MQTILEATMDITANAKSLMLIATPIIDLPLKLDGGQLFMSLVIVPSLLL